MNKNNCSQAQLFLTSVPVNRSSILCNSYRKNNGNIENIVFVFSTDFAAEYFRKLLCYGKTKTGVAFRTRNIGRIKFIKNSVCIEFRIKKLVLKPNDNFFGAVCGNFQPSAAVFQCIADQIVKYLMSIFLLEDIMIFDLSQKRVISRPLLL